MPLIKGQRFVELALNQKNSEQNQAQTSEILAQAQSTYDFLSENNLKTDFFSPLQQTAFLKRFKFFAQNTNLYNQVIQKSIKFKKVLTYVEDNQPANGEILLKNVLPKGNFLLLLEGMNAGKKCISGVFCSTTLGSEKHQS